MTSELRECPLCECELSPIRIETGDAYFQHPYANDKCILEGYCFENKSHYVEKWNHRPGEQAAYERGREEEREACLKIALELEDQSDPLRSDSANDAYADACADVHANILARGKPAAQPSPVEELVEGLRAAKDIVTEYEALEVAFMKGSRGESTDLRKIRGALAKIESALAVAEARDG